MAERYVDRATEPEIERDTDALRDSEERFRRAFEASPTGFAIVEIDGRFRAVNRSMSNLLGYSEAELLARTFRDITHPEDLEATVALRDRLAAGASLFQPKFPTHQPIMKSTYFLRLASKR